MGIIGGGGGGGWFGWDRNSSVSCDSLNNTQNLELLWDVHESQFLNFRIQQSPPNFKLPS